MAEAYRVRAHNSARESENRIHDDAVARRFGFTGGLVPGVEVYAYMAHVPVARWGRAWLEHGSATCRFSGPVYEEDEITVESAETPECLELTVRRGADICATGTARLDAVVTEAIEIREPPPAPADRPPADEQTLEVGTLLAMRPMLVTPELAGEHRADVRETDAIYAREGLMHPGMVLRACNWVLKDNVVLGPWIHVGSAVRHLGAGRIGEKLSARACVSGNYERKGHRFVELQALVMADARPIAQVEHVAIYRPRIINQETSRRAPDLPCNSAA